VYFVSRLLLCFWVDDDIVEFRDSSLLSKLPSSESVSLTGKGLALAGAFINRDGRLAMRFRFPSTVMVDSLCLLVMMGFLRLHYETRIDARQL